MDPTQRPQTQHVLEPTAGTVAAFVPFHIESLQQKDDGRAGTMMQETASSLVGQPGQEFLSLFWALGEPHKRVG